MPQTEKTRHRDRPLRLMAALTFVALAVAAASAFASRSLWAQAPWPTPPPGPFVFPQAPVREAQIVRAKPAAVPGAAVSLIQPAPLPGVPRVPPLAPTVYTSLEPNEIERIRVRVELGAFDQTTQLLYQPVSREQAPAFPPASPPLRVFQLVALDARANPYTPVLRRPLLMEVPVPANAADPARLLIWQYQEGRREWLPLLTSWDRSRAMVFTRLTTFGYFAVAAELPLPPR